MAENVSFTQFENKISSQMQLPVGTFVLKYKDDEGDSIPIASDIELAEAVRQAATRSPPLIEVIVETCRAERQISNTEPTKDTEKENREAKQLKCESSSDELVIHPVVCSICQFPIVGTRYKCAVCPSFDLCELCEVADNSHPVDHPLIKAKRLLPPELNSIVALSSGLRTVTTSVENGAKQVVGGVQTGFHQLTANLHHYQQHLKQSVVEHQPQIDAARQQALEKWRQFNQEMKLQAVAISENLKAKASELTEKLRKEKEQWFSAPAPEEVEMKETNEDQVPPASKSSGEEVAIPTVAQSSSRHPSALPAPPSIYSQQIGTLASMGFTDTDRNISLLSRYQGDVSLCIQTLLDGV